MALCRRAFKRIALHARLDYQTSTAMDRYSIADRQMTIAELLHARQLQASSQRYAKFGTCSFHKQ